MKNIIIFAVLLSVFSFACSSWIDQSDQANHVVEALNELKINRFKVSSKEYVQDENKVDLVKVTLRGKHMTFICYGPNTVPADLPAHQSRFIEQVENGVTDFRLVYSDQGPLGIKCELNTADLNSQSIVYTTFVPYVPREEQ